ncbi:glucosaminidase domain-containing protein [Flavobacterium psychrophilum]|uniref:glucosaminidase domain-containing protein n=1 Tax=Flavobacterium psychrophilum TaxID=96345 RepID=UPI00073E701C|nr:glucosaminidase domain-containing protein [Flavobacterium psychrophilum]EKT4520524.1 glucosaminidase domain-containing protein [Flavobacterium psychrophilum]ELY1980023.1 glucosaminidase domain-containing protein [Flavobacterium psychrophilum]ELY2009763.1 glucosaminidase domain-containing protein [Flavobacterium psychrophilum]SNB97214.1 putative muramidase [Flavobacterium psychrophilum]GAQ49563.1 muramidase [Flavobacterium psychrophilum]
MKRFKIYFFIVTLLLISNANYATPVIPNNHFYIEQYKILAEKLSKEYKIPACIILGIAIVESASGTSKIARKLNNHFGFVGKNNVSWSRYKQYESIEDSYRDFCKKISQKAFYSKIKDSANYLEWIDKISKTGYSTAPKAWRKKITTTIVKHKLI